MIKDGPCTEKNKKLVYLVRVAVLGSALFMSVTEREQVQHNEQL